MTASSLLFSKLEDVIRRDETLMALLNIACEFDLPQWRLVSGCLYQTVWNRLTGKPRGYGIKDYDLIYFDEDRSYGAEDRVIRRISSATQHLKLDVEVRNQARVHLWYKHHFGQDYSPLESADESLNRYAATTHALGVRLSCQGEMDIIAPFGLDDVFSMTIRPNHDHPSPKTYALKAQRMAELWPELTILEFHKDGHEKPNKQA